MYYNEKYYLYPYYSNNKNGLDDSSFLMMINEMYNKRKSNGIIIENCIIAHKEKIGILIAGYPLNHRFIGTVGNLMSYRSVFAF